MKQVLRLLAAVFMLGSLGQVQAAPPKPKIPAKVVYLAIKSGDPAAMTITVEPRNSMATEAKTYRVTPTTVVKVYGNAAALADLKPDMAIHFTLAPDNVTAMELSASRAPVGAE